ncbi:AraC family transcriptional regulator [Sphingomonas sp.]|uniref:AraC family transcriptional regulator n=1 Tax=Sphingomonas sp. TaxID=28214 RepID=UPI001D93CA85|nr:AraC family transcriptional regulator [Sphingomonas sp.]MBX9797627.1 AraC family transcriptional regulator [Sphingomonas sp.]
MGDVLSNILDTVALKAASYFHTDFRPPFGVELPALPRTARFHLALQGSCWVQLGSGASARLSPGDLVLVPHGAAHRLLSAEGAPAAMLATPPVVSPLRAGQGPAESACRLVCGHFTVAAGADHPLLRALPELIHITAPDRARQPMLDEIVGLITRRLAAGDAGATTSISRLSEVLFIEMMHASVAQAPAIARIMAAVHDPQIGRALSLIHDDVASAWTVARLASAAAMSRSRFAERFRALVGLAPMHYVAEWRLQTALSLLNGGAVPVKVVAARVGFKSAAAFTRAFSARYGVPPARLRRQRHDDTL